MKFVVKLLVRTIVEAESEEQAMELAAEELRLRLNQAKRNNEPLKIYFDTAWPEPVYP